MRRRKAAGCVGIERMEVRSIKKIGVVGGVGGMILMGVGVGSEGSL
jgi:hypothetical protein